MPSVALGQTGATVDVGDGGTVDVGNGETVGRGVGGTLGGAQAVSASTATITQEKMVFFMFHSPVSSSGNDIARLYFSLQSMRYENPLRLEVNGHFLVRLRNRSTLLAIKPVKAPRIKPICPVAS